MLDIRQQAALRIDAVYDIIGATAFRSNFVVSKPVCDLLSAMLKGGVALPDARQERIDALRNILVTKMDAQQRAMTTEEWLADQMVIENTLRQMERAGLELGAEILAAGEQVDELNERFGRDCGWF